MAVRNTPFWVLQAPTLLLWATIATMTMTSTTVGAEIDPGADFSGYMDDLKKKEEAAEKHRNLVNEHEVCGSSLSLLFCSSCWCCSIELLVSGWSEQVCSAW